MKFFLSSSTIIIFIFLSSVEGGLTSCSKDKTIYDTVTLVQTDTLTIHDTAYPIEGLWIGTYLVNADPTLPARYFSYGINPDGTMLIRSKGLANSSVEYVSRGTWTLNGSVFTGTYQNLWSSGLPSFVGDTQTSIATYDSTAGTLIGIWTNVLTNDSGTYTMHRVN